MTDTRLNGFLGTLGYTNIYRNFLLTIYWSDYFYITVLPKPEAQRQKIQRWTSSLFVFLNIKSSKWTWRECYDYINTRLFLIMLIMKHLRMKSQDLIIDLFSLVIIFSYCIIHTYEIIRNLWNIGILGYPF